MNQITNINWGETQDVIERAIIAFETVLTVRVVREEKPTVLKQTKSLDGKRHIHIDNQL